MVWQVRLAWNDLLHSRLKNANDFNSVQEFWFFLKILQISLWTWSWKPLKTIWKCLKGSSHNEIIYWQIHSHTRPFTCDYLINRILVPVYNYITYVFLGFISNSANDESCQLFSFTSFSRLRFFETFYQGNFPKYCEQERKAILPYISMMTFQFL